MNAILACSEAAEYPALVPSAYPSEYACDTPSRDWQYSASKTVSCSLNLTLALIWWNGYSTVFRYLPTKTGNGLKDRDTMGARGMSNDEKTPDPDNFFVLPVRGRARRAENLLDIQGWLPDVGV